MNTKNISLAVAVVSALMPLITSAQEVPKEQYAGMKWRLVGPFRGGRSVAVAGSSARPNEYYFGATGGGLWKSTNAGKDWDCVSDGFFNTASVGAVAVSASSPDVVYAGMGERDIRGNISEGDGVYKSTDGGKTWKNVGLVATQTISKILVHPTNPDVVWVAALGHVYGPNKERGIYKSTDGGTTWKQVLFESDKAGAVDLSMEAGHPETLYASTWEAGRTAYSLNSGGPGSKLWKSTDGGNSWKDISRMPGMPSGELGKIGVSVSPADPKRVYAIVENLNGGIYRSDDGGATWKLVNSNRNYRQRAWYYSHVIADPKNADTYYVLNVGMARSTDGGATLNGVGTPHSDNHDLWINPDDPNKMIEANDGGASVSLDRGRTWSDQDVPTAQFYHVSTDKATPYHILGAQQDNSSVRILSRTSGPGIGPNDWTSTAGGESGYVTANPKDSEIVLGGNYGGDLEVMNHRTGQSRDVNPWPDNPMGAAALGLVHRMQWTFPIVFSPNDPNILYTCSQYLMKSTNLGQTWKKISPDLTRNDPSTLGSSGGNITKDNTAVEYYGTVFTVAESPLVAGLIWTGSDDGLVHMTRASGGTWANVTPSGMPKWGLCSMIEASPHSAGTAFLAVDNHENDDLAPYIYRTDNYGSTWRKLVDGIPSGAFVRAVRQDPKQPNLLYAGTERGIFVSFDGGNHWQSIQLNLPLCPVHDLTIKDDDLIVATHGRSFWVLDDTTPLQILAAVGGADKAKFYHPKDSARSSGGGFGGGGGRNRGGGDQPQMGENPPSGIVLNFFLPKAESVTFEFTDSAGLVVATRTVNGAAGMNRTTANLSYAPYRQVPGMIFWAAGPGRIQAPPGQYSIKMTAGSVTSTQYVNLLNDPKSESTDADLRAQFEFCIRIRDRVNDANDAVVRIRDIKKGIDAAISKNSALSPAGEALKDKLSAVEGEIYQVKLQSGQDALNYPIKLNNKLAALLGVVSGGSYRPTDQSYEVFGLLSEQLQKQLDKLEGLLAKDLASFNKELKKAKQEPISIPKSSTLNDFDLDNVREILPNYRGKEDDDSDR